MQKILSILTRQLRARHENNFAKEKDTILLISLNIYLCLFCLLAMTNIKNQDQQFLKYTSCKIIAFKAALAAMHSFLKINFCFFQIFKSYEVP